MSNKSNSNKKHFILKSTITASLLLSPAAAIMQQTQIAHAAEQTKDENLSNDNKTKDLDSGKYIDTKDILKEESKKKLVPKTNESKSLVKQEAGETSSSNTYNSPMSYNNGTYEFGQGDYKSGVQKALDIEGNINDDEITSKHINPTKEDNFAHITTPGETADTIGSGSGFAISKHVIVTNNHVANNRKNSDGFTPYKNDEINIYPLRDGNNIPYKLKPTKVQMLKSADVTLLFVEEDLSKIMDITPLASEDEITNLKEKSDIKLTGYPVGRRHDNVVNYGETKTPYETNGKFLLNATSIHPVFYYKDYTEGGMSGSPIISNGELIGIHAGVIDKNNGNEGDTSYGYTFTKELRKDILKAIPELGETNTKEEPKAEEPKTTNPSDKDKNGGNTAKAAEEDPNKDLDPNTNNPDGDPNKEDPAETPDDPKADNPDTDNPSDKTNNPDANDPNSDVKEDPSDNLDEPSDKTDDPDSNDPDKEDPADTPDDPKAEDPDSDNPSDTPDEPAENPDKPSDKTDDPDSKDPDNNVKEDPSDNPEKPADTTDDPDNNDPDSNNEEPSDNPDEPSDKSDEPDSNDPNSDANTEDPSDNTDKPSDKSDNPDSNEPDENVDKEDPADTTDEPSDKTDDPDSNGSDSDNGSDKEEPKDTTDEPTDASDDTNKNNDGEDADSNNNKDGIDADKTADTDSNKDVDGDSSADENKDGESDSNNDDTDADKDSVDTKTSLGTLDKAEEDDDLANSTSVEPAESRSADEADADKDSDKDAKSDKDKKDENADKDDNKDEDKASKDKEDNSNAAAANKDDNDKNDKDAADANETKEAPVDKNNNGVDDAKEEAADQVQSPDELPTYDEPEAQDHQTFGPLPDTGSTAGNVAELAVVTLALGGLALGAGYYLRKRNNNNA